MGQAKRRGTFEQRLDAAIQRDAELKRNTKMLSESSRKALNIIAVNPGIGITDFARQMWPDSDGWNKPNSAGKNRGYGMIRAGQSYLDRLLKTGLITEKYYHTGLSKQGRRFYITDSGKAELRSA